MQLHNPKREVVILAPWRLALLAMAREIEKRGFCRLIEEDLDGSVSLVGAVNKLNQSFSVEVLDEAYENFSRLIDPSGKTEPSIWAEQKERTQQDVVSRLREAAYQVI